MAKVFDCAILSKIKKESHKVKDPTQRFSNRVGQYIAARPAYPPAVIETLITECQLTPAAMVADVGSGTGKLSELFLNHGNQVFGIEPNPEMRQAAEQLLSRYPNFNSIAGRAEATMLPDHSVDFVTAGQAFHWFNLPQAQTEFKRILKPQGWVVLVWNIRGVDKSPMMEAYERFARTYTIDQHATDPGQDDDADLAHFFGPAGFQLKVFENSQSFDFEGLKSRWLSSSFAPEPTHPQYKVMLAELERLFESHQVNGRVRFEYETKLYYGQLKH